MPPVNRNLTMQARRALYQLKRDYGARIDIYKLGTTTTAVRTGVKTVGVTMFPVERAIVLPNSTNRTAVQSISLISSNKEFVTGGTYDVGQRKFIVDRLDCPSLPELTADDWLVYNEEKYQIKDVDDYEVDTGWILTARKLVGETPEQHRICKADHLLVFTSVATATVE